MIQVGKPVKGEQFIGREAEIRTIIEYLQAGQSVVLIAPRRFGKTSLVLEVLRRLKRKKIYTGFSDVFEQIDIEALSQDIIQQVLQNDGLAKAYTTAKGSLTALLKSVKLKALMSEFEFLLEIEDSAYNEFELLKNSISFIDEFATNKDKKIVFAFDEYGDTQKFENNQAIVKMMRTKIQRQSSATYLFLGSYESVMETMFVSPKSPFYRLAKIVNLGYMKFAPLKKHMTQKLKSYGLEGFTPLVDDCLDFMKCHPYYCQLCIQQILLYHTIKGKMPSFDELLEIIIDQDRHYLESQWGIMQSNQEMIKIMKYLSHNESGVYGMATKAKINASRNLKKLIGMGVLYKSENGYKYYDPVYQYWVANRING